MRWSRGAALAWADSFFETRFAAGGRASFVDGEPSDALREVMDMIASPSVRKGPLFDVNYRWTPDPNGPGAGAAPISADTRLGTTATRPPLERQAGLLLGHEGLLRAIAVDDRRGQPVGHSSSDASGIRDCPQNKRCGFPNDTRDDR